MNFDFSEDQKFLSDQAQKFLANASSIDVVRSVLDDGNVSYHKGLWQGLAEMGWLGASIPEEYDGLGLSMLELCVIAEQMGRALAPVPFSSTVYLFAEALKLAGSDEQKRRLLPKLVAGDVIGCVAVLERAGSLDYDNLSSTFSNGHLSGVKLPVIDGDIASHAIVLATENGAPTLVLVDLEQTGVSLEKLNTIDPTRSHARMTFQGVEAERLGEMGQGAALFEALQNRAAVLLAFEQIGGSDRTLEMATRYAKERYAFGRPIGGNQAIKHKLADMWVKNEVARSSAYYGAWALSTDAYELAEAAALARIAASDAFWFASKENIQTHGGMGFTWEVDCHLFYRRAQLLSVQLGATRVWKQKLVSALEKKNAA